MKLRQSTIANIMIGPFLDSTDGNTEETGLTINAVDVRLSKNGGSWAGKNDASVSPHNEAGFYQVTLNATDTNTTGRLKVASHIAGALYVWENLEILDPATYDAMFTDGLNNFDPATDTVASVTNVTLVATTTNNTDMRGTDGANTTAPDNAGITANGVAIAALNDISVADVNAQVLDVMTVDTFAELSGVPGATSTILDKITWSFMLTRNKFEQTATTTTLRNDADTLNVATSSTTDDGTTFTRNEFT